jgi:hypothetical protein
MCICMCKGIYGRVVGQAGSRRLPTAEARARARFKSCWACGGLNGSGAGYFGVLRFPMPLSYYTNCSTVITMKHTGLV